MWHVLRTGKVPKGILWGDLTERDHLEDLGVDKSLISIWIFKKWGWRGKNWIDQLQDMDR
jgi:hypothetical protein